MSQIALRLARLGDAPRIANLSRILIEAGLPWSWTPRRVANHMRSREHLTVIAPDRGELAGFVLAQFGSRAVHLALLETGIRNRVDIVRYALQRGWLKSS